MTRQKANTVGLVTGIQSTAAAIAIGTVPSVAIAQNNDAPVDDQAVEEIVVTGSRLVRRDATAPSPIMTVDKSMLSFSGQETLESTLNRLPQLTPSFDRSSNNPGDGTARINLRGLGSGRTLVMLNGRRLAPSGIGSSVDANNLPQALVDRVEIITGGASTVYGSDAIAGVVNVITRNDFDGFEIGMSGYTTEYGDSESYDINVSYGHNFANGKGNITLFGGYYDRSETFAGDREFSSVSWFDDWFTGELVPNGSFTSPEGITFFFTGNPPPDDFAIFTWDANGDPRPFVQPDDLYNYAPVNYLQIPLTRYTGGLFLNYELGDKLETYVELTYTRNETVQNLAPVPAFTFSFINSDNPEITPANRQFIEANFTDATGAIPGIPNLYFMPLARRLLELGPRIFESQKDYSRVVAGLRGDIAGSWDFDFWVTYTKGDEVQHQLNGASQSRLQQGFLVDPATGQCYDPSGGCVPVDIFGPGAMSAEAIEYVRLRTIENLTTRTQKLASFFVRGELFSTWAGPVNTAFGLEWRNDEGGYVADDLLFTGDALGVNPDTSVNGEESVTEVYVEALVPLAEDTAIGDYLGLEIGGRYSEYEHAGSVDSYKFGIDWQLNSTLRFRAMGQRSVRAPNLEEAFAERQELIGSYARFAPTDDPCSASSDPIGNGNLDACVATGLPANQVGVFEAIIQFPTLFVSGGNPGLQPETAETVTIGTVITPEFLSNWEFSIDYYQLEVEDEIGDLDINVACFDPLNVNNLFCGQITRDSANGYNVSQIDERTINRGVLKTRGIDTQVRFSTDLPAFFAVGNSSADLLVTTIWTHLLNNSSQPTSFGTVFECAGLYGWPCSIQKEGRTWPQDRVTTTFNYGSGDFNAHLTWQWISSVDNAGFMGSAILNPSLPVPIMAVPKVDQRNYLDLGLGYQFTDQIVGRFTISNLLDQSPPQMANNAANNTDTALYDIFGRSYTLKLSVSF